MIERFLVFLDHPNKLWPAVECKKKHSAHLFLLSYTFKRLGKYIFDMCVGICFKENVIFLPKFHKNPNLSTFIILDPFN